MDPGKNRNIATASAARLVLLRAEKCSITRKPDRVLRQPRFFLCLAYGGTWKRVGEYGENGLTIDVASYGILTSHWGVISSWKYCLNPA